MKRYIKELFIFLFQLSVFYISPLFANPRDMIGMVLLIVLSTFLLSFSLGVLSNSKIKYFYPLATALAFLPSVFIYYNESALIHSIWYLVVSIIGLALGLITRLLIAKASPNK